MTKSLSIDFAEKTGIVVTSLVPDEAILQKKIDGSGSFLC